MSSGTPNRPCGRCGEPVDQAADICPHCGALLAAYEAPRGSSSVSEATTQAPARPVDHVPAQPRSRSQTSAPPSPPRAVSSTASTSTASAAEPAIAAARADLVSGLDNRRGRMEAFTTATRADLVTVLNARESAIESHAGAPTRSTPPRRQPPPARETRTGGPHVTPAAPLPTRQAAATAASFGKLALGVLLILVVLGILDVNLIPILVLGVVMLSLLGVMRSAAKASGRKTTTMHDPKRRDPWKR